MQAINQICSRYGAENKTVIIKHLSAECASMLRALNGKAAPYQAVVEDPNNDPKVCHEGRVHIALACCSNNITAVLTFGASLKLDMISRLRRTSSTTSQSPGHVEIFDRAMRTMAANKSTHKEHLKKEIAFLLRR